MSQQRRRIRDMHGLSLKHAAEAFRLKPEIRRREIRGGDVGKLKQSAPWTAAR